eukprot:26515-Eustigmatos_ZCMA.PRE.1
MDLTGAVWSLGNDATLACVLMSHMRTAFSLVPVPCDIQETQRDSRQDGVRGCKLRVQHQGACRSRCDRLFSRIK